MEDYEKQQQYKKIRKNNNAKEILTSPVIDSQAMAIYGFYFFYKRLKKIVLNKLTKLQDNTDSSKKKIWKTIWE